MPELTLVEAVNDALHVELGRDDDVMVMGEDVGRAGGVFRATAGLRERFGPDRCVDTPLAEAGILGTAVGLCMAGWRPVCEMQYDAFSYPVPRPADHHVGRYRWRTGGEMAFPITIRMPVRRRRRAPELHDDSPEDVLRAHAGRQGRDPVDAGGREGPARGRDSRPRSGGRPRAEARLPHRARRGAPRASTSSRWAGAARPRGDDVTLVAYGAMVRSPSRPPTRSRRGLGRGARPADAEAARRGRAARLRARRRAGVVIVQEAPRTVGYAAEVAAILAEKAILDLRGPGAPRHGLRVPYPYWQLED